MNADVHSFLAALHQGGRYGYWWVAEGRRSYWWKCGKPTALPSGRINIYVGVHPTADIPTLDRHGNPVESRAARSSIATVSVVNCLFAEYDAKDHNNDKTATLAHVETLDPPPSIIIDSGGGYHCYWLLTEPCPLTTDDCREKIRKLQAAWVVLMGGDTQAKDLARVLRVPGTYNHKYTPPRQVTIVSANYARRYAIKDLMKLTAPFIESETLPTSTPVDSAASDKIAAAWLGNAVGRVRSAPDGKKHDILLGAARALGGLVPLGLLTQREIEHSLYAAIEGRAADGKNARQTILDGIAYGIAKPWNADDVFKYRDAPPHRNGTVAPVEMKTAEIIAYPRPISAAELALKEIEPSRFFIPEMLRAGLALFIGNPGVGKTPMLIQLALAFASGGKWLGAIDCPKCRVLYIGVEYEEAYIKEVAIDSYGSADLPVDLFILSMETFTSPRTADESIAMLEYYLTTYQVDVIITDTFSGFLPTEKFKQNAYRGDYAEFLAYHRLLTLYRALLVGSWHGGKYNKDPETAYNGGQGMWGSAGGGRLTMMRDEQSDQVRFRSQLRGYDRKEWVITQARVGNAHFWSVVDAEPDPIFGSEAQRRIYQIVKESSTPSEPITPAGIRGILAQDAPELGIKENYIRQMLMRFVERGIMVRSGGGYVTKHAVTPVTPVTGVTPSNGSNASNVTGVTAPLQVPLQSGSHPDAANTGRYSRYSDSTVTKDQSDNLLIEIDTNEDANDTF